MEGKGHENFLKHFEYQIEWFDIILFSLEQLRMLMGTMYVAGGLTACLMNVEEFVEPFQQILMRSQYVTIASYISYKIIITL